MKVGDLVRKYRGTKTWMPPWKKHGLLAHGLVFEIEEGKGLPKRKPWGWSGHDDLVTVRWLDGTWTNEHSRDLRLFDD